MLSQIFGNQAAGAGSALAGLAGQAGATGTGGGTNAYRQVLEGLLQQYGQKGGSATPGGTAVDPFAGLM